MTRDTTLIAVAALASSVFLTGVVRRFALLHGVLDIPNQRSSHRVPTPRGGGVAIVLTASSGFALLTMFGVLDTGLLGALLGGLAVATVGFLDDRRPMRASIRLAVHFAAALWALAYLGGVPPVQFGNELVSLGAMGNVLGALVIVWTLNLFNFMDGIDGLATSEAVFISWSGAVLCSGSSIAAAAIVFGAACCGFLVWNRPPAKIFMGDAGSGFLGYVIGVLILSSAHGSPHTPWVWLILGGVFYVDATVTLARRALRGERVSDAHRSHAYQWLSRRWGSHGRVTSTMMLLNLIWLLPCAYLATIFPSFSSWIALGSLVPLVVAAIAIGAGRREGASSDPTLKG